MFNELDIHWKALGALILVIIGSFLIYVCCCFGNHRPPLEYNKIVRNGE